MSAILAKFPSLLRSALISPQTPQITCQRLINVTSVDQAARKGTREKAKKKKVKVEIKKVAFVPYKLRLEKNRIKTVDKPPEEQFKLICNDDVWAMRYYQWKVYPIAEAVQCLKESNDPTVFNNPDAFLNIQIELNMQLVKKTKFVENFSRVCTIPHGFDMGEKRKILVFCKEHETHHSLLSAGATLVGGVELVKKIQNGDINPLDYDHILCHPNILLDIVPVRGLLKKKFPNPRTGSVSSNLIESVKNHIDGIEYIGMKHEHDQAFGRIKTFVGRLNMETQQLEENLVALIKNVNESRPKRDGLFITRCFLHSDPSKMLYKINPFLYIESGVETKTRKELSGSAQDEDSESDDEKAEVTNN